MQVLNRQTSICAKLTYISQRLYFSMDTGKHHLLQPAYGILKKLSFISVVSSISKLQLFFLPLPVDLFSSYNYVGSSNRCTFQQNKKAHRLQ